MTKEQLIEELASRADVTKAAAAKMLDSFTEIVVERASEGQETHIHKFGTFSRRDRKERVGRSPQDGSPVTIPASSVLAFKPSKTQRF